MEKTIRRYNEIVESIFCNDKDTHHLSLYSISGNALIWQYLSVKD